LVLALLVLAVVPTAVALAKGKTPIVLRQSTWHMDGTATFSVQKLGSIKVPDNEWLYFGENGIHSLDADEFLLVSNGTGGSYRGTWSDPKQNGKPTFDIDPTMLADNMWNLADEILNAHFQNLTDIEVTITKYSDKVTLIPGGKSSATLSVSFTCTAKTNNSPLKYKCTLTITGTPTEV
jgi:hypothetical protein